MRPAFIEVVPAIRKSAIFCNSANPQNRVTRFIGVLGLVGVITLAGAAFTTQSAFAQDASAQAQSQASAQVSPLNATAEASDSLAGCDGGPGVLLNLQYDGAKPLRGFVLRLDFTKSSNGNLTQRQFVEEVREPSQPMIQNGDQWSRSLCTAAKTKKSAKPAAANSQSVIVTVDALKFADNSIWGPASMPESHQMIGKLDGMDFKTKNTELRGYVTPITPEQGPFPVDNVQTQTIGPLRFESGVAYDELGRDVLAIAVTNESSVPIRGYLFTISFFDPDTGSRLRRVSNKELETQGDPSAYLAPGATWIADPRQFTHLPDGRLASYIITLDMAAFSDGTVVGPLKSPESQEVLGMFDGIDAMNRAPEKSPGNSPDVKTQ